MTEFSHSEVLFAGDDGLPIQFNIQNTTEKEYLKSLIEYSGGICTLSDDAIILVSPGTKVLSILANKNLISTRYILDCVKEDCLLDTDEYRIEINEMEASDFSDSSNLPPHSLTCENNKKISEEIFENSVEIIQPIKTVSPLNIMCPNSNHDFDFQDSDNRNFTAKVYKENEQQTNHCEIPLQSAENNRDFGEQKNISNELFSSIENRVVSNDDPVIAVVSSSQENPGVLDQFDNMILNKVQEKPIMDEDSLSQSYTVSSSADAHVSPNKASSSHHTSAEIFDGAPDSASQTTERQQYINNLEKEVEQILKKPSPKSIQDKIILVKYISTVKKLAPAIVLQTLQNF